MTISMPKPDQAVLEGRDAFLGCAGRLHSLQTI